MSVTMKALKDFRGEPGEGNMPGESRMVEAGPEFKCSSEKRADDLERRRLAVRVVRVVNLSDKEGGAVAPAQNKAAEAGPLASAGGQTGAEKPASSSPAVHQPRRNQSKKSDAGLDI